MDKKIIRQPFLDITKGLAMLLVVMQHVGGHLDPAMSFICKVDVPLFFIVSGYLAYKPDIIKAQFIKKKFMHIIIPFLLAVFFSSVYYGESLVTILSDVGKHGYWFLQALFIIFCVYILVFNTLHSKYIGFFVLICLELIFLLCVKLLPVRIDSFLGISYLARYMPCFFIGVYLRKYNMMDRELNSWLGLGCLVLVIIAFTFKGSSNISFPLYVVGYACSSTYLLFMVRDSESKMPEWSKTMFSLFGKYSLNIYIIHFFLIWQLPSIFHNFVLDFIITLVESIFICYLSIVVSKVLTFATPLKKVLVR